MNDSQKIPYSVFKESFRSAMIRFAVLKKHYPRFDQLGNPAFPSKLEFFGLPQLSSFGSDASISGT
jgi:hypothetical protein